ncbi:MAG: hypothetical protein LQ346_005014 [Caloplaca aetnensis]|nr:MAG: hypothetical protein LQ346_005014 [Caloplaca aetnensis]
MKPAITGFGSVGIVYQISETVAVKRPLRESDSANEGIRNEYRIYELLSQHQRNPNILQSFHSIPTANFLAYLSGGTLDARLRQHQTRDHRNLVCDVARKEPRALQRRWIAELVDAAAWLEHLGYAHGDLRPVNMMLDSQDHLKLIDFNDAAAVGAVFEGYQPPYARVLGEEARREDRGTFGYHGPRTEQFAIGSVMYYLTRGFEVYDGDGQWFGKGHGPKVVGLLQKRVFPPTGEEEVDGVIRGCWYGRFESIQRLKEEVMRVVGPEVRERLGKAIGQVEFDVAVRECRRLVAEGILDQLPQGS